VAYATYEWFSADPAPFATSHPDFTGTKATRSFRRASSPEAYPNGDAMCGIAGALIYDAKTARLDCLLAAVDASNARGVDSFGVVRWSPSTGFRSHYRFDLQRDRWLDAVGEPEPNEPTIFLHTSRAEPTTEWVRRKTDKDIPPFVVDGIAVAQNGIVANDDELVCTYHLERISPIDTAVIPSLVARLGIWPTVAELKGGSALAIFDSASGHLALCRNFMPLVLAWSPGIVCFASEAEFFPGARSPFSEFQLWELPPYTGLELSAYGFRGPFAWGDQPQMRNGADWQSYPRLNWSI
jgi:7-cyano-7-deazaguanine synthase